MIFIIPYVVYPFDLMVAINEPYSAIKKELKKCLPNNDDNKAGIKEFKGKYEGRTIMFSGGQTCISLNSTKHGLISHEVFHAVEFLFRRIYIPLTLESGEAYAYFISYIVDEIYKHLDVVKA